MSKHQSFAVGNTLASKYGKWGISGTKMVPPCEKIFGLCVGFPNCGKTEFFSSHEGALIINCDLSSTPMSSADADPPKAQFFPGLNDDGMPIGVDGKVVVMGWEPIEKLKAALLDAAAKDQPRPQTIILDTLNAAIHLIKQYIVKERGKDDWRDLDGRQAWDILYDTLIDFAMDLRRAGYGVYFVCHLVTNTVPVGEDKHVIKTELTITGNFYKRLYPMFELVMGIEKKPVVRTVMEERVIKKKDGTESVIKKPKSFNDFDYVLSVDNTDPKNEDLRRILKSRVKMPSGGIPLPAGEGWSTFSQSYREHAKLN